MNLDGSNDSDLQNMSLNGDQSQPAHQSIWKKIDEIMEILYHILRPVLLVLVIIATIQKFLEILFPGQNYKIAWILTYAFFAVITALLITVLRTWIWQTFKAGFEFVTRPIPQVITYFKKLGNLLNFLTRIPVRLKRILSILVLFLILIVISIALYTQTQLGNLTRSWLIGPIIDIHSDRVEETFQPTINLPWFKYGQDFGEVAAWKWNGVSQIRSRVDSVFTELSQRGVKCILWFLFSDGRGSPQFDSTGAVTGLNTEFWKDYDTAIEIAKEHDIGIIWVLIDHKWMFPSKPEGEMTLFGHADVIADSAKRASFFQNAFIPILRRYPFEPHIVGWILINEPENALKDGFISFEFVNEFIREAANLVKENTYRQPVSIATADLESLLEYSNNGTGSLDFLVFHHYEQFLPPPASYIHTFMPKSSERPIFIGEFNIKAPPISIPEFVTWTQRLGYAGLWPWSLIDNTVLPRYDEVKLISNTIKTTREKSNSFREKFNYRHELEADSITSDFRQEIHRWLQHGSLTVLPTVERNMSQWRADSLRHERQDSINVEWRDNVLAWLDTLRNRRSHKLQERNDAYDCIAENQNWLENIMSRIDSLRAQIRDYQDQLSRANRQLIDLRLSNADTIKTLQWIQNVTNWLRNTEPLLTDAMRDGMDAQNGIRSCEQWIELVNKPLEQIESDSTIEARNLSKAKARIALHRSLVNWNRYKLKWADSLYQKFWEAEIEWGRTKGVIH